MNVGKIFYAPKFGKEFKALPQEIKLLVVKKEKIFQENPLHPSLRLHSLKGSLLGTWSLSITMNYRIIFERMENGDILFHSVGTHDIYKNL